MAHIDNNGHSALSHAVSNGHIELVKFLCNCPWADGGISACDAMQSAFVVCSGKGHSDIAELLLERLQETVKCHVDAVDVISGETALTAACLNGRKTTVQLLLTRGAMLTQGNARGLTPLLSAVKAGYWDIAVILLRHGADIETTDSHGRSALMIAAAEGHVGLVEMLLTNSKSFLTYSKSF